MLKRIFKSPGSTDVAINMLLSGLFRPISMIVNLIYIPIVLRYLGVEKYGVWSTVLSILSWIGYLDIGIGNGLRNKLTASIAKKDIALSKRYISSTYAITVFIMVSFTIVAWILSGYVSWENVLGVEAFGENLVLIIRLSIALTAFNFVLSICRNVLFALQKASVVSVLEPITQVLNLGGVLFLSSVSSSNLLLIACIYGSAMIITNLVASLALYSKHKELRPTVYDVSLKTGGYLVNLGVQFFIIQLCALVLFTTDNLIISNLYGAIDVTPYSAVNRLFNAIAMMFTALLAPIWSSVTKAKVENNYEWMRMLIRKLWMLMVPFFAGAFVLGFVFEPVAIMWLGQALNFSPGLIILGVMYGLLTIWCNTYSYIANGLELMRPSIVVAVVQAVMNIPLSLFFAEALGWKSAGVLAGTVASMMVAAIAMPIYVHKNINRNVKMEGSDLE